MKNKQKIFGIIVGMILLIQITYSADYYQLLNSNHKYIDKYSTVLKNTSGNKYFIPTKTSTEWNSLLSHKPTGVSVVEETFTDSYSCAPGGTMWLRLYQHNGALYAVQGSVNGVYKNYWSTNINFVGPYTGYSGKTLYRGSYVSTRWLCQANVNIYKVIVVDN